MKTRKFLAILLTLAMCLGMLPGMAMATPPTETSGDFYVDSSNENLYHIANLAGLKEFRNSVNGNDPYTTADNFAGKTIQLDADINLSGENWEPIGIDYYKSGKYSNGYKTGKAFAGIFDGNGNTISNLSVATSDSSDSANGWAAGLFGLVTGTVQNLTINNAKVSSATRFAGAVAGGVMSGGAINNCKVTGTAEISGRHFVGGVAGLTYGTISGCTVNATGTITASDVAPYNDGDDVGGIVGFIQGAGNVTGNTVASDGLTVQGIRQAGAVYGNNDKGSESNNTSNAKVVYTVATADQLKAALAEAKDGDTIKLAADLALTESVAVAKKITLDLNGKTISTDGVRAFVLTSGADMTVEDNGTTKGGITATRNDAFYLNNEGEADKTNASKVKLDIRSGVSVSSTTDCAVFYRGSVTLTTSGSLSSSGDYAAIQGNGSDTYATTVVTVTGGSVTGSNSIAIYFPNPGTLNISGGTLSGKESAVELRAGTLNVTGGTFTATADSFSCTANGNGTTTVGAGIAIAQHDTKLPTSVTISGGTLTGYYALSIGNPQNNDTENVTVSVSGGQFNGSNQAVYKNDSRVVGFITGGSFSSKPDANYLAANKASALTEGLWVVGAAPTATEIAATLAGNVELTVTPTSGSASVASGENPGKDFVPEIDEYKKISVPAKDMNAAINITVAGNTQTVTVAEYLKDIINTTAEDSTDHKIAQATLNYGNAAAKYFNPGNQGYIYTSADDAELSTAIESVTTEVINALGDIDISGLPDGVEFIGASLVLKSQTALRLNFRITDNASNFGNFKVGGQDAALVHRGGEYYYIVIDDSISPDRYSTAYRVTYGENNIGSVCVNNYVKKLVNGNGTAFTNRTNATVQIGKALYLYGKACETKQEG